MIWLFLGFGPESNCDRSSTPFHCLAAFWPADVLYSPLEFLAAIPIAPFFHSNELHHILFVSAGVILFVQSFEVRAGFIPTVLIFFLSVGFAAVTVALGMNLATLAFPDDAILKEGMARNWKGGSVGFFGIIGASAHQSSKRWLLPVIAILFEIWNHNFNDIILFTSAAHLSAMGFGFLCWGWWTSRLPHTSDYKIASDRLAT